MLGTRQSAAVLEGGTVPVDPGSEAAAWPAEYLPDDGVVDGERVLAGELVGRSPDVAQPVGHSQAAQPGPQALLVEADVFDGVPERFGEGSRDLVEGECLGAADVPGLADVCGVGQCRDGEVGDVLGIDEA